MSSLQVEGARVFCLEPRELLLKIREPLLELDAHLAQKVIDGGTRIENDR